MRRSRKFEAVVRGMSMTSTVPITVKIRTGIESNKNVGMTCCDAGNSCVFPSIAIVRTPAHQYIPKLKEWGASLVTLHGRSRQQRYTKLADWEYIGEVRHVADVLVADDLAHGLERFQTVRKNCAQP